MLIQIMKYMSYISFLHQIYNHYQIPQNQNGHAQCVKHTLNCTMQLLKSCPTTSIYGACIPDLKTKSIRRIVNISDVHMSGPEN